MVGTSKKANIVNLCWVLILDMEPRLLPASPMFVFVISYSPFVAGKSRLTP